MIGKMPFKEISSARRKDFFSPSFSVKNRLYRAFWTLSWLIFARWTPPPLHKWRIIILKLFGANISFNSKVYSSAKIWDPRNLIMKEFSILGPGVDCYCQDLIEIGEYVVVSQRAFLCTGTHDTSSMHFNLKTKPICIMTRAWIAAEAFVGPGVSIGEGSVLGARAVTFADTEAWGIYAGNPATKIKQRVIANV